MCIYSIGSLGSIAIFTRTWRGGQIQRLSQVRSLQPDGCISHQALDWTAPPDLPLHDISSYGTRFSPHSEGNADVDLEVPLQGVQA